MLLPLLAEKDSGILRIELDGGFRYAAAALLYMLLWLSANLAKAENTGIYPS